MEKKNIYDVTERDYPGEILAIIRGGHDDEELRLALEGYHDNDIASIVDELTDEERDHLREVLGNEAISEILPYLDDVGEYLSVIDRDEAADIIEMMDADEALEVLDDLDDEVRQEVLDLIEDEIKEEIELIDSYDEDEMGSRMSTNFIAIPRTATVKGAMKTLVKEAAENDNIYTLFVTIEDGSFYGAINLKELIIARSETPLDSLIYTAFPTVYDNDSISESIERLRGYSEDMIPVLSHKDSTLLGVITAIDLIELVDEELGDDYAKLAALTEEEEESEPIIKSVKKRIAWLIILLFLGLGVSAVVGLFEGVVDELPMIVAFQSLILGMAGNVGTQSLAVTVRSIGSEDITLGKRLSLIFKETRIALLNGLLLGIFSFAIVGGYLWLLGGSNLGTAFATSGCVGAALWFAMTISGFTGAAIPITFHRLGIDPAVASGPLITTVNDLVAVLSYYGLAWAFLINFAA